MLNRATYIIEVEECLHRKLGSGAGDLRSQVKSIWLYLFYEQPRSFLNSSSISKSIVFPNDLYDRLSDAASRLETLTSEIIRERCENDLPELIALKLNGQKDDHPYEHWFHTPFLDTF